MKNKMIYGAYGGVNAGDEYILDSIVKLLDQNDVKVICEWPNISNKTKEYYSENKIVPLKRNEIVKVLIYLVKYDLIVGGGQIINGGAAIKSLLYILMIVFVNRASFNKPRIIAAGISNIKTKSEKLIARLIFRLCEVVTVRDNNSLLIARDLNENIIKTADIVYSRGKQTSIDNEKSNVIIAIHGSPTVKYQDDTLLKTVIEKLIESIGSDRLKIVCHDRRREYDVEIGKTISEKYGIECIVLETPYEVDELYSKSCCIVSARMHPLIIGSLYGADLYYFGESPKILDLALLIDIDKADTLLIKGFKKITHKICSMIKMARSNIKYLR